MKALIFGAGRMGIIAGKDLKDNNFEVHYADIIKKNDCIYIKDLSDDELIKFFKYYDVILGTADYSINAKLTKLAIEAGTNFCDLGGNNDIIDNQFQLDSEAKKAGVIVIPDCGVAPGWAGLLAAYYVNELNDKAINGKTDEVIIRVGGLPQKSDLLLGYQLNWSARGLINEYKESCEIISDGITAFRESLEDLETLSIFNVEYEAFNTSGGLSTLGKTFANKINNLSYKTIRYPGHCNTFKLLKDMGFFEDSYRGILEEVLTKKLATKIPDKVIVYVKVKKHPYEIGEAIEIYENENGSAMGQATGYGIALVAKMLASGEIKNHTGSGGVFSGEVAIPLENYFKELMPKFKNAQVLKF